MLLCGLSEKPHNYFIFWKYNLRESNCWRKLNSLFGNGFLVRISSILILIGVAGGTCPMLGKIEACGWGVPLSRVGYR
jgi:hypothetical protein